MSKIIMNVNGIALTFEPNATAYNKFIMKCDGYKVAPAITTCAYYSR